MVGAGSTEIEKRLGEERRHRNDRRETSAVKTIPTYLRLHSTTATEPTHGSTLTIDPIARFWQAYTTATGWRVAPNPPRSLPAIDSDLAEAACEPEVHSALPTSMSDDPSSPWDMPGVSRDSARKLAAAAIELTRRYQESLESLRRQEGELALAALPAQPEREATTISDRLQRLLTQATEATGCEAAAIYFLDDQTSTLKLRASIGLPAARLAAPPRDLRGSRGDLESLVREFVLIDNLRETPVRSWKSPEDFPSAIIVRLEEEELPIGTLWLWSKRPRQFTQRDGAAARLAATAITAELARTKSQRQGQRHAETSKAIQTATQWQLRQLPPAMEIAPRIIVDGWTESPRPWACSWHAWDVLPDGKISLALAEADPTQLDGAMIAATARAAFAAHSNYRHSVSDMLSRLNDSLWQTNTGEQIVSLLYAQIDPDTGEGVFASAGKIQAIIASRLGFRPLCAGNQTVPLGKGIDSRYPCVEFVLQPGEVLVAVNSGVLDPATGLSQSEWAGCVRRAIAQKDRPVLPEIRRALAEKRSNLERAGLMLLRKAPKPR